MADITDILPVFGPNCRNKYMLTGSFGSINVEILEGLSKIVPDDAKKQFIQTQNPHINTQCNAASLFLNALNAFLPHD